jgi:2-polyprenylphenol 6-hydroxylase
MNKRFEIVIVGAGVTGLTVASLLAQSEVATDLKIRIIDAAPRPTWNSDDDVALRVSAVSGGSASLLDDIGAWQSIEAARVRAYDHMRVWDEALEPGSASTLCFDADEFAVQHLGYIVENVLVQHALLEVLDGLGVELIFESPIASIEINKIDINEGRHRVHLQSDSSVETDLIIGADGGRSLVRESAGIDVRRRPYEQTAFVTHVSPEESHANTAWQRFLRDGPLGLLPLADGRLSIVWSTTPDQATHAMQCSDAELGELLTDASDYALGKLKVNGPRGAFPLGAQHANDYVRRGIALIGDAAHTVHPLAGQGANLGLQDAEELATVIIAAMAAGEHPADRPVLRRYERARKGANATMMHFMTGLNRLFASDSSVLGELRRTGMQLFNRSGPVKKHVVGVALGAGRQ